MLSTQFPALKRRAAFKDEFELFRKKFAINVKALGELAERFSPSQFTVLKSIELRAVQDDFLSETSFDEMCAINGIVNQGPWGRDSLLAILDKLCIVMHFAELPFLTDYVLIDNGYLRRLHHHVFGASEGGRLSEADLVGILRQANPSIPNGHALSYPPDRCRIIADAMIAFRVAYRLGTGKLVIPALLAPGQPEHDFRLEDALAFRFDFGGFLPRQVLPALIVEHFQDIAKVSGNDIVWQNGALLRPCRLEAKL